MSSSMDQLVFFRFFLICRFFFLFMLLLCMYGCIYIIYPVYSVLLYIVYRHLNLLILLPMSFGIISELLYQLSEMTSPDNHIPRNPTWKI